jgi:hypothetical protein
MSNQDIPEIKSSPTKKKSGEINHLLPNITSDEINLEFDTEREDEIRADRPPHHN